MNLRNAAEPGCRVAYAREITAAAARHRVDPLLLAAVAAQETGGPGCDSGRNVVGDGGHGRGLFQIDDRFHPFARSAAAMEPSANADYAAGLLADNLRRYGGNVRAALSAYNAGSPDATGTTTDWGDGRPIGYAASVLRHYDRLEHAASPLAGKDESRMNLLNVVGGAAQGFLMSGGNPVGAIAGGVAGMAGGGTSATGTLGNGLQGLTNQSILTAETALGLQNQGFELALNAQAQQFNQMAEQRSELMREQNQLRDIAMMQRKADDAITKEFIKMIG